MQFTTTVQIDRQLPRYNAYRKTHPEGWQTFEERVDLCWLYHDQAMEGLALREDELTQALQGAPGRHHSEGQLFEHIRHVMFGIQATRRGVTRGIEPLSLDALKDFHTRLASPDDPAAGRYRKVEGPMVPYTHEITRTPSISYRLRKLVDHIETSYADMHPVIGAAMMHHEFMQTWPFDARSGTAGRLLLNHWLMSAGYPPAIIHATDRQAYYQALEQGPEEMVTVIADAIGGVLHNARHFFARRETAQTAQAA